MPSSLTVVLLIVCLDAIGFGIVLPILPDLLKEISSQVHVANHFGWFLSVYALMQFLCSPVLGALSDRFGRRPVLLVSLAGAAVDYVIMGLAPNLTILYIGRIIAGITGANMAVATSSIADVSNDENRAKHFGMMHSVFGIGFVIGPLIGGVFGAMSLRYPFLIAAALNGVSFLLALFVLKESLPEEKRRTLDVTALNPFKSLRWVGSMPALVPFLVVFIIVQLAGQMPGSLWIISSMDRYGWSRELVGASFSAYGLLMAISQAFLTGPVTKRLGEFRAMVLGLSVECICYVLFAFATQSWMVFALLVPLCFGGIAHPAIQSMISRQVSDSQQGELQGSLVSLMSLVTIIGPIAYTWIYDRLPTEQAGLIWLIAAGLYCFCLPIVRVLGRQETVQTAVEADAA
jgi:DHA1 family tetracycline resistance protein-like MFS transporter